ATRAVNELVTRVDVVELVGQQDRLGRRVDRTGLLWIEARRLVLSHTGLLRRDETLALAVQRAAGERTEVDDDDVDRSLVVGGVAAGRGIVGAVVVGGVPDGVAVAVGQLHALIIDADHVVGRAVGQRRQARVAGVGGRQAGAATVVVHDSH